MKLQIVLRGWERKRVYCEVPGLLSNIQIGTTKNGRERLEATPNIEDEG